MPNRRGFLKASTVAALAGLLPRGASGEDASADANDSQRTTDPFGGFRVGIQSFSLRTYDFETALKHAKALGLSHVEPFSKHLPLSTVPSYVAEKKALLAKYGFTADAYGVMSIKADENATRELFEFAKAMGLLSISINPEKSEAVFSMLETLVEEYGVPVAIHNHGPGSLFDKADDVVKWTNDRHPLIGACVDTGHYLRSDEDPVEVINRLGDRVFGCHLKDVRAVRDEAELAELAKTLPKNRVKRLRDERKVMTILGEGELDTPGVLKALRGLGYERSVSIEYEENADNPLSDIAVCIDHIKESVAKIA